MIRNTAYYYMDYSENLYNTSTQIAATASPNEELTLVTVIPCCRNPEHQWMYGLLHEPRHRKCTVLNGCGVGKSPHILVSFGYSHVCFLYFCSLFLFLIGEYSSAYVLAYA